MKQKSLPYLAVAAWLLPGSGHLLSDRKKTGLTILVVVNLFWICGMLLSEFEAGSRLFHPWLFWTGAGCGGTAGVSFFDPAMLHSLSGLLSVREYQDVPRWNDMGILLVCIAGLLNVLCLLDVIDLRINSSRRSKEKR